MAKASPKVLLAIASVLTVVVVFLVWGYVSKTDTSVGPVVAKPTVVVAARDIPARTVISADMVKSVEVEPGAVREGSMTEKNIGSLTGKVTKVAIKADEQIIGTDLLGGVQEVGFSGKIPPDKRAFTIAVNDITGVAGFVKTGDYVDIIGVFDKGAVGEVASNTILQHIQVLATNDIAYDVPPEPAKDGDKKPQVVAQKASSVTLAVNLDEAMLLGLAADKGKLHLALRSFEDAGLTDFPELVKPDKLVGHPIVDATDKAADNANKTIDKILARMPAPPQSPIQFMPPPSGVAAPASGIQVIRGTKTGY